MYDSVVRDEKLLTLTEEHTEDYNKIRTQFVGLYRARRHCDYGSRGLKLINIRLNTLVRRAISYYKWYDLSSVDLIDFDKLKEEALW